MKLLLCCLFLLIVLLILLLVFRKKQSFREPLTQYEEELIEKVNSDLVMHYLRPILSMGPKRNIKLPVGGGMSATITRRT